MSRTLERERRALETALPIHPLEDPRLGLYAWQEEAFEAWSEQGRRGIVEAVTGAGKTRLGLAAISAALREGRQALLLVPTIELLHQWFNEIRALLPWAVVGRLGDQYRDDFRHHQVIVSTVQSALARMRASSTSELAGNNSRLLVADEVHRLAAEQYSKVLDSSYPWRLGLSATYERPDGKHLEHLDAYFGGVAYRLWYDRAQQDHLIAPFDIALVGVELTPAERAKYSELSDVISRSHRSLLGYLPDATIVGSQFLAIVAGWAAEEMMNARTVLARKYMGAVSARQQLLAQTDSKLSKLVMLQPALRDSRSTLIFSLTQRGAEAAAERVASQGILATAVYSQIGGAERKQRMAEFRSGTVPVLAAPRVLDEGVDVPEAELGIVLASNRSRRQLVQRLGRVIRRKADGRAGKFVFIYAVDTVEDPGQKSDEQYLNAVLPYARELGWFSLPEDEADLLRFLENVPPESPAPEPVPGLTPKRRVAVSRPVPRRLGVTRNSPVDNESVVDETSEQPGSDLKPRPVTVADAEFPSEPEAWDGEVPERLRGLAPLGRDSTNMYLKQIAQYPLLSAAEEVELGKAIECGVLAQERLEVGAYRLRRERRELEAVARAGVAAHRRFICANLRLVVSIAKKYVRGAGTLDFLDLVQEGNLGLERGLQKWDYALGTKFSTYASWWIQQSITRSISDGSRTIRVPVHKVEQIQKAKRLWAEGRPGRGDDAVHAWVAEQMDISESALTDLFALDREPINLDREEWLIEPGHIQIATLGAKIIDEFESEIDTQIIREEFKLTIDEALATLDGRAERILRWRFGLPQYDSPDVDPEPMTLDAIGVKLGVTRERVRQIEKESKKHLFGFLRRSDIRRWVM